MENGADGGTDAGEADDAEGADNGGTDDAEGAGDTWLADGVKGTADGVADDETEGAAVVVTVAAPTALPDGGRGACQVDGGGTGTGNDGGCTVSYTHLTLPTKA